MNQPARQDYEDAELAFRRSGSYTWCGSPIHWSERHNWLWLSISRSVDWTEEQDALMAMFLGLQGEIETVKDFERTWNRNPELFIETLNDFHENFHPHSDEVAEALSLLHEQIIPDLKASHNILDNDTPEGGAGFTGAPGKSGQAPATPSTSPPPPGSPQTPPSISFPSREANSSTPSSSAASATSSNPQNSPREKPSAPSPDGIELTEDLVSAGDVTASDQFYMALEPHDHATLRHADVVQVVESPNGEIFLRGVDHRSHRIWDRDDRYVTLEKVSYRAHV